MINIFWYSYFLVISKIELFCTDICAGKFSKSVCLSCDTITILFCLLAKNKQNKIKHTGNKSETVYFMCQVPVLGVECGRMSATNSLQNKPPIPI